MNSFFYTDGETGIEYHTAEDLFAFLQSVNEGDVVDLTAWRETMYRLVETPLAWGDLKTASEIYQMVIDVYELAHKAEGREVLR